jgi:hypothetical protein
MQTTLLDQKNRIPGADYLVKGIVPCMVNMKISLVRKNRNDEVDVVALQGDIFNYINGLSSGEPIVVSEIVSLCHNYGIARVDLPLVVNGTILTPTVNDTNLVISGTDFLQIPNLPNLGISPNNTMFYISYFDENGNPNINISVN